MLALVVSLLLCVASASSCSVNGIQINGYMQYLVGRPDVPGSIYAVCVNGTATCHQDNGHDNTNPQVPCANVPMTKHDRQLGVLFPSILWPYRVICLNWSEPFNSTVTNHMKMAVAEIKEKAGFTVINDYQCRGYYGKKTDICRNCRKFVDFTKSRAGCFAKPPGMESSVNLEENSSCASYTTILRSFARVIGLDYEQKHPKRKVVVVRSNMKSTHNLPDFYMAHEGDGLVPLKLYDPMSIMHFPHSDDVICVPKNRSIKFCEITQVAKFDNCTEPTMEHCDPKQRNTFGQGTELTVSDLVAINKLYESEGIHPKTAQVPSKLHRAFAEYRAKTDLTFVNVDRCHDYYGKTTEVCKNCELAVQVTMTASKSGCFGVPWVLSQPEMYVDETCATYPNVLRSIGRVLGLEYEHKHPKRTVVVVRANLKEGARNYEKILVGDGRAGSAPYDPLSIMHFPHNQDTLCVPKDKSLNYCDISQTSQSNCVIPKPEHCDFKFRHTFGTSKELMPKDVRTLNRLYEGVAAHSKSTKLTDRVPFLGKAQVQPPVQPPATRPPRSHWMDDVAEEDADGSDSSGDLDCEDTVDTLQGPGTSLNFTTLEEIEEV
ncbi:hypothetical protein Poli38472_007728 [Pythium oligandrum]|uniref:Peptidase M12A domain-containing protein n=1 Tax=Pythium oligandrum TaxID=41045 RepID=A0A8K1FMB3_PYTOL|nr:hypothetical protein Poli38472_007728 [Pythium oligandrum]|eukprot:TMW68056.1 hypothetical protein Poli38472_007728 [Pythium oligandrum]